MWGFKLKKNNDAKPINPEKREIIANKIAFWLIALQLKISAELNLRFARLSFAVRVLMFCVLGLLLAGYFLKVLLTAIF